MCGANNDEEEVCRNKNRHDWEILQESGKIPTTEGETQNVPSLEVKSAPIPIPNPHLMEVSLSRSDETKPMTPSNVEYINEKASSPKTPVNEAKNKPVTPYYTCKQEPAELDEEQREEQMKRLGTVKKRIDPNDSGEFVHMPQPMESMEVEYMDKCDIFNHPNNTPPYYWYVSEKLNYHRFYFLFFFFSN
jgi:hypothetical protein